MPAREPRVHRSPGTKTQTVERYCKKCKGKTRFTVRVKADRTIQRECRACMRRRGRDRSLEKVSYRCMLSRCLNPNERNYCYYGGRGIEVCERWQGPDGFKHFKQDLGPRLDPGLTLDRLDVDGDYSPENCKWATWVEQAANKCGKDEFAKNWRMRKKEEECPF